MEFTQRSKVAYSLLTISFILLIPALIGIKLKQNEIQNQLKMLESQVELLQKKIQKSETPPDNSN